MKSLPKRDGRQRVVIENVQPEIDAGRFPIKRVIGQTVEVEADAFTDGHDALRCMLRCRHEAETDWHEISMEPLGSDRWGASFPVTELGLYFYSITAWIDHFLSWQHELVRRQDAQDIAVALQVGAKLIGEAAQRATGEDQTQLHRYAEEMGAANPDAGKQLAMTETLTRLMTQYPDRSLVTHYPIELAVRAERVKALYSTWYELFPRSCVGAGMRHGTFA